MHGKPNYRRGIVNFAAELAQQNEDFVATEVEDNNGPWTPPFTEGQHESLIAAARVARPPWENDDRLYLYVQVQHPESGKTDDVYLPLTQLKGGQLSFVKKQLLGLGWGGDLVTLVDGTEEMIGRRIKTGVKYEDYEGKRRVKYFFNKVLGEATVDDGDDIPF
jgi:hypothetical protein